MSLLLPPVILIYLREKLIKKHTNHWELLAHYLISLIGVNGIAILFFHFVLPYGNNGIWQELKQNDTFLLQYGAFSLFISVLEPMIEQYIRNHVVFHLDRSSLASLRKFRHWKLFFWIYAIVLFGLNFIRIFDNNFWGDEAFTTYIVKLKFQDMLATTAADVHPPLYYIFVMAAYHLFGNHGWVYHVVSLIPYAIVIVFSMTAIWKKFGKETAVILITIAGLSGNAITYNVEARMYSWGALFVLLSFYFFICILKEQSIFNYSLFVVFSLAAAYTHYYCVVSVAFFYVVLMLMVFWKKADLKKVLAAYVVTIVGYLPWFFTLWDTFMSRKNNFWIPFAPHVGDCFAFVFSSQFSGPVLVWLLIMAVVVFMYELRILRIEKTEEENYSVTLHFDHIQYSDTVVVFASGIFSVVGTIAVGIGVSKLISPLFLTRYIYPVSIVAWLMVGILISRTKGRKVWCVVLMVYMLCTFLPSYKATYKSDKYENEKLQSTLAATSEINESSVIITDISHVSWTIGNYYYPDTPIIYSPSDEVPSLNQQTTYWLISENHDLMDNVSEQTAKQGFTCEPVVMDGILGTFAVDIYKIEYAADGVQNEN